MFEMKVRVRFSETDENGRLSMSALLRLFQDCGYFHALARGQGNLPGTEKKETWYLLRWHIEAYEMPMCGDEVNVGTWIYSSGGSIARKQLVLADMDGRTLAVGDTMWVYMNVEDGTPALPPEGVWEDGDFGTPLPLGHPLRRIPTPDLTSPAIAALPRDTVDARLLDINHHANNVFFTEYAMSLSDARTGGCFLAAEFRRQAKAGVTLCPYLSADPTGKTVSVCDTEGSPYAVFRFE